MGGVVKIGVVPNLVREAAVRFTRQLVAAGKMMGIPIHDHLIVAGNGYTSMAERQLL